MRGSKGRLVLLVLAVVERVLDVRPELAEHVPGPSCRQGCTAAHQGMGFKTAVLRYLDSGVTVVVLCNRSDIDAGALALQGAYWLLPAAAP